MITGIVTGELYATIQHGFYDNRKLMLVDLTDEEGARTGESLVAIDVVGAGPGEPVLVIDEGNSARQVFGSSDAPVRSVIVGILDAVDRMKT